MAYHQVLWGNGYQEIEVNGKGEAMGLYPLLPDRTAPRRTDDRQDVVYQTSIDGTSIDLTKERVLHVPAMSFDGYIGTSPIAVARQALGLAIAAEEFGAKFFANDAKSGGFLMHPAKLSDQAHKNLKEDHQRQGGLDNAHRVKVLEEGMKFVQTTIPPEDAQFLGTREFQIAEIARIFRVPLVLLQSMEKATSWGTGIEQMMLAFLTWTLNPWIIRTEQEMNRKLFTQRERDAGLFVKLNVNALMRGDMAGRSAFYKSGIDGGWMTRNEAREKEDMNPLPGLDEPLVPLNMSTPGATARDPQQQGGV
jgi:HK97 family phage portal protein